jgi:hypothetical protein
MVYYQKLFRRCSQHWTGGEGETKLEGETMFVLSMINNFVILAGMVSRVLSKIVWNTLNLIVHDSSIFFNFLPLQKSERWIYTLILVFRAIYIFVCMKSKQYNAYLNLSHPKIYAWNAWIFLVVSSKIYRFLLPEASNIMLLGHKGRDTCIGI